MKTQSLIYYYEIIEIEVHIELRLYYNIHVGQIYLFAQTYRIIDVLNDRIEYLIVTPWNILFL